MRFVLNCLVLALPFGMALVGCAAADEPTPVSRPLSPCYPWHGSVCPDILLRSCCDDYCAKPQPCIPCYCCRCGPDDYCAKPCPCVPCYRECCTPDCYCRKPCPDLCRPLTGDYFTCGCACGSGRGRCAGGCTSGINPPQPLAGSEAPDRPIAPTCVLSAATKSGQQH
jgi:hypothetical protein